MPFFLHFLMPFRIMPFAFFRLPAPFNSLKGSATHYSFLHLSYSTKYSFTMFHKMLHNPASPAGGVAQRKISNPYFLMPYAFCLFLLCLCPFEPLRLPLTYAFCLFALTFIFFLLSFIFSSLCASVPSSPVPSSLTFIFSSLFFPNSKH